MVTQSREESEASGHGPAQKKSNSRASNMVRNRNVVERIHHLDWYDVETRIKQICKSMISDLEANASIQQKYKDSSAQKIFNLREDTDKLMGAVFFKKRQ